jgi:GAF domain-containing protein
VNRALLWTYLAEVDLNQESGSPSGPLLCAACVALVGVTGAGITLMGDGEPRGSLGTSDAAIGVVEELQFTLGEGPCVDAYRSRRPVREPDLADPRADRWPAVSGPAIEAGVRAVFGFPLQLGGVRVGALNLYRDEPGDLADQQFADALEMADVITQTILTVQAGAPPRELASEIEAAHRFRAVVHQASGMLSAQLEISTTDALARLRAYAFASERPINDVARDVVARRLRLD